MNPKTSIKYKNFTPRIVNGFNDSIEISGGLTASNRERGAAIRYGNVS